MTGAAAERLLLVIAVVIVVGPFLAERARLPGIVGLVVGGAIVGPSGIGLLEDGLIDGLGEIGLLYLMFVAGLELDLNVLARYRRAVVAFGVTTFAIPLVLGFVVGTTLALPFGSALLLGSLWASHTLVAYPVVKDAGLGDDRAVALAVGSTAITDTLALVILAVVASTSGGGGGAALAELAVGLLAIAGATLWLLPWVADRVFGGIAQQRTLRFVVLLAAFSGAALLAVTFGIEGLVGAFFAGLGLNRLVPNGGPLMARVEFFGAALFIPAFLVFVGTQLDLAVLLDVRTLVLAVVFLGVVVIGKALAAVVMGLRERFAPAEIGLLAGLTTGQAAATLAAALVAQQRELFTADLVNAILVGVLLAIIVSSLVTTASAARVPVDEEAIRPLGERLLLVAGFGEVTTAALACARAVTQADGGTIVPLLVVTDEASDDAGDARRQIADIEARARRAGIDAVGVLRHDTTASSGVMHAHAEDPATLIVVPWRDRLRLADTLTGHEIDRLGSAAPVPVVAGAFGQGPVRRCVLVVPPADPRTTDDADLAVALRLATTIARSSGRPLDVWTTDAAHVSDRGAPPDARISAPPDLADASALADGAVVILPLAAARGRIATVVRRRRANGLDASLLVVAGPHRLRRTTVGTPEELSGLLGY